MLRVLLSGTRGPMLLAVALLTPVAACTSGEEPTGSPSPRPSPTVTEEAPDLSPRPRPYRIRLATVAGHIPRTARDGYVRRLAAPVRTWVDEGFVEGPWPREEFTSAFAPFSRDTAARARRDGGLLTLRAHGAKVRAVFPERRRVTLSASAVRGRVVGATARVDLRFLAVEEDGQRVRVNVRGDLFLTRNRAGRWKVFGYRLDRWEERGAMTAAAGAGRGTSGGGA